MFRVVKENSDGSIELIQEFTTFEDAKVMWRRAMRAGVTAWIINTQTGEIL